MSNIWTSLDFNTVQWQFYYEYAVLLSILSRGSTFDQQSMISKISLRGSGSRDREGTDLNLIYVDA